MSALGKLVYKLYYQPKNKRAIIKKYGGRQNYLNMLAAEREMKAYALNTLSINFRFSAGGKFKLNFLTGEQFIHQTLFCTYSFFKFLTGEEAADFSVNYYSDGTLSKETVNILNGKFPSIRIIGSDESERALAEHLPQHDFPFLNKNIVRYPLFKKLIYPNLNGSGILTFFDSDMLFLKRPIAFLDWLYQAEHDADQAFGIQDVNRSYGYREQDILSIWPNIIEHDINSGLYAIHSKNIDWLFIEDLAKKFEVNYGQHYYLEQLITAIILEKSKALSVAPKSEYIVFPSKEQVQMQEGTLHHYVNQSKEYYFKESWKRQVQ